MDLVYFSTTNEKTSHVNVYILVPVEIYDNVPKNALYFNATKCGAGYGFGNNTYKTDFIQNKRLVLMYTHV